MLNQKRRACLERMGDTAICHPDYVPNPRHSTNPAIYPHFRVEYLNGIRARAAIDRDLHRAQIKPLPSSQTRDKLIHKLAANDRKQHKRHLLRMLQATYLVATKRSRHE